MGPNIRISHIHAVFRCLLYCIFVESETPNSSSYKKTGDAMKLSQDFLTLHLSLLDATEQSI